MDIKPIYAAVTGATLTLNADEVKYLRYCVQSSVEGRGGTTLNGRAAAFLEQTKEFTGHWDSAVPIFGITR